MPDRPVYARGPYPEGLDLPANMSARPLRWQLGGNFMACHVQDAFVDTISFAVLRHLVSACEAFKTLLSREHETNFVANVLNAVKYVCDKRNFRSLSRRDADMAKEWLGDLSSLYRQMQRVRALVCRKCITAVSPYDALYTNTPLSLAQCTCQLQTPR